MEVWTLFLFRTKIRTFSAQFPGLCHNTPKIPVMFSLWVLSSNLCSV